VTVTVTLIIITIIIIIITITITIATVNMCILIINIQAQAQAQVQEAKQSEAIDISVTELDTLSAAIVENHNSGFKNIAVLDLASRRHVGGCGFCPYGGTYIFLLLPLLLLCKNI
jgi:flagellar basal body-associated protein FliL